MCLKYFLKPPLIPVYMPECLKKKSKIDQIEGPVHETYCLIQLAITRINYKFIRRILEYLHHSYRTSKDHLTVSPCNSCCKESGNFYIAFPGIPMRNAYRIELNKGWTVVQFSLFIK